MSVSSNHLGFIGCVLFLFVISDCATSTSVHEGEVSIEPDEGIRRSWRRDFDKLDVLFVIDVSRSMEDEQENLRVELQRLVEHIITSRTHENDLAVPIEDVHIGFVTTDLGAGGHPVMTCDDSPQGDDGILRRPPAGGCMSDWLPATDCPSGDCPWIWHLNALSDDGCSQASFTTYDDVACLGNVGTEGCGFSQPLEAMARALTVHTQPGGANEGFQRPDAFLKIIFITDSDDCSAADGDLFDPARDDLGPLNERCFRNPEMLRPVEDYVELIRSLRQNHTRGVAVSVIGGFPEDSSWQSSEDPIEALRRIIWYPFDVGDPVLACQTEIGSAHIPPRLVEFIFRFGSNSSFASICRDDWAPVLRGLHSSILPGRSYCPPCPMATGDVAESCHFVETLPDDRPCPHLVEESEGRPCGPGWHRDLGLDDEGRRRCEILSADRDGDGQLDSAPGADSEMCNFQGFMNPSECIPGWFLEPPIVDERCVYGTVFFSPAAEAIMSPRSILRLECQDAPCREWLDLRSD